MLPTKNNPEITWVGIDVSKAELEIHSYVKSPCLAKTIPNTQKEIKKLITQLRKIRSARLVFEATGGYEKLLLNLLQDADLPASRITPSLARSFAKAKGLLAKTDAIDAQVLTDYGLHFSPQPTPKLDPIIEEVHALIKYRRHLGEELHRERQQLEHMPPKSVISIVNRRKKAIQKEIDQLDERLLKLRKQSKQLDEPCKLLTETIGVGDKSALALLVSMPELGTLNRNQVAALAGVAPINRDSGKMRGKRMIFGGRKDVRQAIYMASLSAARYNPILKKIYQDFISRGKPKKLALTAVMRKLLIHLNAVMKRYLGAQKLTQTA